VDSTYALHGAAQEKLSFDPSDEVAYRYERAFRAFKGHAGKSDAQSNSGTMEELAPNRFNIKENSRQSRRQKRRQARLGNIEATEESSDEARQIIAGRRVPREPVERLAAVIKFLGSYDNDVGQIECALGDLLRKDERIRHLSATVQELRRSKNEEIRMIEEEQSRLMELQSQLSEKETSLNHTQQALEQASRKLKEGKHRFQAEEAARYDKAIETEKTRLGNEFQKQVKQNEQATAAKLDQATQQIRQLQHQVSSLSKAKDDAEITLALFKDRTKELQDQQKELESRYKTQNSPLPEL
jgi:myosin heavy subunit